MRAWHFSETAYHLLPPAETYDSIRVSLPNRHYDPRIGADLYHRYLDEWLLAEDEGLEIMLNEHHQTATCVDPAAPLMLAALARQSTQGAAADSRQSDRQSPPAGARGRGDGDDRRAVARPAGGGVRARRAVRDLARQQQPGADERARMGSARPDHQGLDASRRAGQLRGPLLPQPADQYLAAAVAAAASADLDQHHQPRAVRRASVRTATCRRRSSPASTGRSAIFDAYRNAWREAGRGDEVPHDRLAYAALVYTGETEAAAHAGAEKLLWYITSNKVPPHFAAPPGYMPVEAGVRMLRGAEHPLSAFRQKRQRGRRDRRRHHDGRHAGRRWKRRFGKCTTMSAASAIC